MENFTLAIIFLTIGFGAGYFARSYLSHLRRSKAREDYRQQQETRQQGDPPVADYVSEDHFSERGSSTLDERNSTRLNTLLEIAGSSVIPKPGRENI